MPTAPLLIGGAFLCLATIHALRGGWRSPGGLTVVGMDAGGLLMGGLSVAAAMWVFGPLYGLALVVVVAIHEFGHVAAFRVCGHHDARFRLIPLMGGVAISDRAPATQEDQFYISLMGPAIGIGPMVLAYALVPLAAQISFQAANFLLVFASVTGALNFFNMLPFWPLDGGKMVKAIAWAFWPPLAILLSTMMSAALIVAAIGMQSFVLFFFALLGAQSLLYAQELARYQTPMSKRRALLAAGAYLATAATLGMGGIGLILRYL